MSRWIDQYKQHLFFQTFAQIDEAIKGIKSAELDANAQTEMARLAKVLAFTKETLDSSDHDLMAQDTLNNINSALEAVRNELNTYNTGRNEAHLKSANQNADAVIQHLAAIPTAMRQSTKAFQKGVEAYQTSLNEYGKWPCAAVRKRKSSTISRLKSYSRL